MKLFLMAAAMFGTVTYGSTDLFDRAQDLSEGVNAVYVAATEIDHTAHTNIRMDQQENLYEVADTLAPMAERFVQDAADAFEVAQADIIASHNPYDAYRGR